MRRNEQEIKDLSTILSILTKAEICRIALHDEPYPYIVPLNFGFEYNNHLCLYFHCAREGRKLDLIKRNNRVCFEVETDTTMVRAEKACGWTMKYKSVIGVGDIEIFDEPEKIRQGLTILMAHYAGHSEHDFQPDSLKRSLVLRLQASSFSAKRHGAI